MFLESRKGKGNTMNEKDYILACISEEAGEIGEVR